MPYCLQLQGDFTLRYAVTITDKQTSLAQLREYKQLRADYRRELKKDPYFQPVPAEFYGPSLTSKVSGPERAMSSSRSRHAHTDCFARQWKATTATPNSTTGTTLDILVIDTQGRYLQGDISL